MELKINPRKDFPGRGPCIEMVGDWVTEDVWNVVNRLMNDNWIDSPVYRASQKCHAFFQGGSSDSKGKWILLEFWAEEEQCQDFIKILNEEVNKVIKEEFTKIRLVAKTMNEVDVREVEEAGALIADETKCPMSMDEREQAINMCRVIFSPTDSVTYRAVYLLTKYTFGLRQINFLDKWEVNNPNGRQQVEIRM